MSEPLARAEEDEPVVNDASSRPPAGGVVSDSGVFDACDEDDALDVTGVAVTCAEAATVLAAGTSSVPMAVRTPANVPSEINMVTIQEVRNFFILDSVPGPLSRR